MNKVIFDLTIVFIPSQFLMHVEKGQKPCIAAIGGIFHTFAHEPIQEKHPAALTKSSGMPEEHHGGDAA
ncbi:hypothetical protein [Paenibacillus montanisoli]|uniref:hypothetical protein n=1 Tax=Paenibacillus montanisoli TaxID=2081970 RepID=UPI0010583713|nr:hypothetical protein [Paenibacillus montanisoli]